MSSNSKSKNQNNLSFTQKCIMLANISQDKNLIVLNPLNFVPFIKLYTSHVKQQIFTYTKVKGGIFILKNKNAKDQNIFIRIYNNKDYSLLFNLEISHDTKYNYIKLNPNFYCFSLKFGYLGFKFVTKEESEIFYNLLINGPKPQTLEEFGQLEKFIMKDSDNEYLNIIDKITSDLDTSYQKINREYVKYELDKVDEYLIFLNFLQLSKLLSNTEYDYEDYIFNIYVDKKYPYRMFKQMFKRYNLNRLYPLRLVINDYLFISDKENYINILVENMNNNFKEEVFISQKRRETKVKNKISRESSKSLYSDRDDNEQRKIGGTINEIIREETFEDSINQGSTKAGINKLFCGLIK